MSSAEYSCKLFKPKFAYRQTVWTQIRLLLKGAVWSGSTLFATVTFKVTSRRQSRRQLLWLPLSASTVLVHTFMPEIDNCPSWIREKGENDHRKYFTINLHERTWWGSNLQPYHQSDTHPTELQRPATFFYGDWFRNIFYGHSLPTGVFGWGKGVMYLASPERPAEIGT